MRAPASGATVAPSPSREPVTLSSSIGGGGYAALGTEKERRRNEIRVKGREAGCRFLISRK
jgi:hypothetical protein